MSLEVQAPLAGSVLGLDAVTDPVFSQAILGAGTAVDPLGPGADEQERVTVTAPVAGRLSAVHPHAFVVTTVQGREVLVHLGLDTVGHAGAHFAPRARQGQSVKVGDPVITWSPTAVKALGLSPVVPVVALGSATTDLQVTCTVNEPVQAGDALFSWVLSQV